MIVEIFRKIGRFFKKLFLIILDTLYGPESHSENRYTK